MLNRVNRIPIALVATLLAGCPSAQQSADTAEPRGLPAEPRPSVALRVVVVNEPELAEAIDRLRGEWAERTGGELSAATMAWTDVIDGKAFDADLVIFPSRYMGELCVRDWLRPVRPNVLESERFNSNDIFPLVRLELMKWGGPVMALPLGVNLLAIGKPVGRNPGISLLVAAAPNAVSNDGVGVLFDAATMKPRITESPFVEALTQLTQSKTNKAEGSDRSADERRVPVFGFADRLIAVTTASRNAASAFTLLAWLASAEVSSQLATAGDGTLPVRRSMASSPAWYDAKLTPTERADQAKVLEDALSKQQALIIPRIPGVDDYMAALDQAVKDAVDDEVAPNVALEKAAQHWEEFTNRRGREAQRRAYLKHLGISEP